MYHTTMFGQVYIFTLFWWRHYDVTEHFDGANDVLNRKIVEKWEDMESLRKFYGAIFEKLESLPYWSLLWVTENTRPVSKMEYTHEPEKKIQNLHSIQEKRFFKFHFIQFKTKDFFYLYSPILIQNRDFTNLVLVRPTYFFP